MSLLGNQSVTPKLHSLRFTQSLLGIVFPILFGTNRVPQNLLGYWDFKSGRPYQAGGKGLGKSGNAYEYYAAVLGSLCQGKVLSLLNVYSQNGRLTLNSTTEAYVVPSTGGSYTVANAAAFAADSGAGAVTAYDVTYNDYGSPGPQTQTGNYIVPHTAVSGSPGSGQYSQSNGTYTFPASSAGQTIMITYSYSLYVIASTEDYTIPISNPYEITVEYAPEWRSDLGVIFVDTGQALGYGSGPGQYTTDGNGNYFFNSADGGRAIAITYSWRQSNSNIDPASTLSVELIAGTQGQSPWPYLSSLHASAALGYSTIACVGCENMDLGQGATLPNYNFEVMHETSFGAGILDAAVNVCIREMLMNPYFGVKFGGSIDSSLDTIAADYWNSNSFFISPVLSSAQPCASIIEKWLEAGNTAAFWSENTLKFVPYGDTTTIGNGYVYEPQTHPVFDLDDEDYLDTGDSDEDPVQVSRTPFQDAFNIVKVQFTNRDNAYNDGVVTEQDDYSISLYDEQPEGQRDYSFICTTIAAQFSASIAIKRLVYIRGKYYFIVSSIRYCALEPMDLVTITDEDLGLNKTPVRIIEVDENDQYELHITAEEFPWGTATATLYPKQPLLPPPPPPAMASPGDTEVVSIFEPTSRVATTFANSAFQLWMALRGGPNWGGCVVWMSKDGQTYQQLIQNNGSLSQYGPTRCGYLTADLPAGSDPDTTNTLKVKISGQLFNVSVQQADALSTLCKVGSEYLSYADVTLTGTDGQTLSYYDLNYLRRGAFSTPNINHAAADPNENNFIRLDSQVFQYSFDPSLAGKTIFLKFTSYNLMQNQQQSLDEVAAIPYTISGVNLSANMTVDAVLDSGGLTATIRIYKTGGSPGDSGSAVLDKGGLITLPAESYSGENIDTVYYVNFDPTTSAYVLYTDENQWILDEQTSGMLRIGQIRTPGDFALIPLLGGGNLGIGAGWGNYGASIPIPTGMDVANLRAAATPRIGWSSGTQMNGVYSAAVSGSTMTAQFSDRSNNPSQTASVNWAGLCWTTGAAVTETTSGALRFISCTTAFGDELCFVVGSMNTGDTIPVPSGFSASNFVWFAGISGRNATGNGLQGVQYCYLDGSLRLAAQYNDNDGGTWGGSANVFGVFWKPGGNVYSEGVMNGTGIVIPLGGNRIAIVQAQCPDTGSFTLPAGFGSANLVTAAGMSGWVPASDHVSHGWVRCDVNGTQFFGTYRDGSGNDWSGYGNVLAIANL